MNHDITSLDENADLSYDHLDSVGDTGAGSSDHFLETLGPADPKRKVMLSGGKLCFYLAFFIKVVHGSCYLERSICLMRCLS